MVDVPIPPVDIAPVPADGNMPTGNLFQTYNPMGAAGGMFAPAYIKGFAPSEQAVADWRGTNRGITSATVDQLRMPQEFDKYSLGPTPQGRPTFDVYGSGAIPQHLRFGDQRGIVDTNALRAASMGTPYDIGARRDAIASQMLLNHNAISDYEREQRADQATRGEVVDYSYPNKLDYYGD